MSQDLVLQVRDLNVWYRPSGTIGRRKRRQVLHDVSFDLHRGEILGLVGESGSGKTTLARTILGFVPDYTGTVSRIALNRVRYVAIFEGVPIQPAEPAKTAGAMSSLRWSYVLIPIGVVAAAGAGVGGALLVKRKRENADEEDTE